MSCRDKKYLQTLSTYHITCEHTGPIAEVHDDGLADEIFTAASTHDPRLSTTLESIGSSIGFAETPIFVVI